MTRRYYHPELPSSGGLIQLDDNEAQHAARVMRVETGDKITLFDGVGHEATAEIVSAGRREVTCQSGAPEEVDRESSAELVMGIAFPKPERAREMVERLTELGVARITPIIAQRSQRAPSSSLIGKLRRAVIEASKQCGRNQLLIVDEPEKFAHFVSQDLSASHTNQEASLWIAHPSGEANIRSIRESVGSVIALVGPEGGWSDDEVRLATERGYQLVGLGKRLLRVETAAALIGATICD